MPGDNKALYFALGGLGIAALLLATGSDEKKPDQITPGETFKPGTPSQFIKKVYPDALKSNAATGVPALVTLAQAGIESGYGKHGPGNNFFGIKAGTSWKGETQKLLTWEVGNTGNPDKDKIRDQIVRIYKPGEAGNPFPNKYSYRVYGIFRKYPTPGDGFRDHANFLKVNPRYKPAFAYTSDPVRFAEAIAKAGYATAPNYAKALKDTITLIKKIVS